MEDIAACAPRTAPARTAQKAASGIFLALLAAGACALAVPANANATTVAGHVTDHLTGEALGGVRISIWYQLTPFATYEVGAPVTASDGSYTWVGACGGGALHVCHVSIDDARYVYADTPFPGDTANVTADIALVEPATISGDIRVNGAIADGPLELAIMRADGGQWAFVPRTIQEQSGGHYAIRRVPPGADYRVCAGGLASGALEQCFDHHDRTSLVTDPSYDLVSAQEGQEQGGVDFDLTSGGRISGTLHDGYLGRPLADAGIAISFYDASGTWLDYSETRSDASGHYAFGGIPAASYYVTVFIDNGVFYDRTQLYPGIACDPDCPPVTSGQMLTLSNASPASGIDFTVHPSAVIRGRVTDATTGQGLGNVGVWTTDGSYPSAMSAAGSGDYLFYTAENSIPIHVFTFGSQPYIDQVFPGIACIQRPCSSGQTFNPTRGDVFDHVDFALQAGSAVEGTVLDATTGMPYVGTVSLYDSTFNLVWSGDLDSSGSYASGAWYPGTYYVKAEGYAGYAGYDGCAFYDARPCPADGQDPAIVAPTPITIGAGEVRTGIDFHLLGNLLFVNGFDW